MQSTGAICRRRKMSPAFGVWVPPDRKIHTIEKIKSQDKLNESKDDIPSDKLEKPVKEILNEILLLRESSSLLPPSQPIVLRSGKKEEISQETMLVLNRSGLRHDIADRTSISQNGLRKTRLVNFNLEQGMAAKKRDYESESVSDHLKETASESDVPGLDIFNDALWDTDLNTEIIPAYDHSGRSAYENRCKKLGATPISYFLRHMEDDKLDLRYHGLGVKGTQAVTPTLATSCHIHKLDLTDNNLNRSGGLALCEMIKENCFISELILSSNKLNSCMSELCSAVIQNDTLTYLDISNNNLNDAAATSLAMLISNARKLKHLDISHNNLEDKSGKIIGLALSECTSIKHVNLSWNNMRTNGIEALGNGLKNNDTLTHFDISWNGIDKNAAKAIGEALKSNSTLEHLDMSNCRVNVESSVLIAIGISSNSTLKILKMLRNPMQSAGCYAICTAVLRNQNSVIEELNFQNTHVNKDFEDLLQQVKEKIPNIKVIYGCQEAPKKPKAVIHPMARLVRYLDDNNIRLADCFGTFDEDGSMTVTHEEFIKGIESIGLKLDDTQKAFLLHEMDRDGDGEIDYSELVRSRMEFKAKANSEEYLFPKMHVPLNS
ncbi:leucine-rich repeat-containing protein 74B [Argonauta hians]